jgi:hypothetical protein
MRSALPMGLILLAVPLGFLGCRSAPNSAPEGFEDLSRASWTGGEGGTIYGLVTDSVGCLLEYVQVWHDQVGTLSDTRGRYSIRLPRPGEYEIQATKIGYTVERVTIELRRNTQRHDIEMSYMPLCMDGPCDRPYQPPCSSSIE